jgi:uncharacterized protein (TIGR02246 family)
MTSPDDWLAIRQLTSAYNRAVDDGDSEAFANVFRDNGVLVVSRRGEGETRRIEGRSELRQIPARRQPGEIVHVATDAIIEVAGDSAVQQCTLLLVRRSFEDSTISFTVGRYTDRLARDSAGWRFVERSVVLDSDTEGLMPMSGQAIQDTKGLG